MLSVQLSCTMYVGIRCHTARVAAVALLYVVMVRYGDVVLQMKSAYY